MENHLTVLMLLLLSQPGHLQDVLYSAESSALTVIPNDIPSDVTILGLRDNNITSVGPNDLHYVSLKQVDLRKNQIDQFSSDAFGTPCVPGPCVQLDKLLLAKNTLDTIPDFPIIGPTLRVLDMSYNNISSLPSNVLLNLVVLEELNLAGNPIFWPTDLAGLENVADTLVTLSLSHAAEYGSVSDLLFLQNFTKLKGLYIEDIKLYELPDFTGYGVCNTLEIIHATNNLLHDSFIPNIDCLTVIKSLVFHYNEFEQFPVFSNSIRTTVEEIDVGDQFLYALDETLLTGMLSLQRLTVTTNDIEVFPVFPQTMTHLTHLDFSSNLIADLTREHFEPLPNLQLLDISHNQIQVLPDVADLYSSAAAILHIVAAGNPFLCDCGFNFTLRASDAYGTVPNMNVTLSVEPCSAPFEYVGVPYIDMRLYDFCSAFSTVTTTAMETTSGPETTTMPDTTTTQVYSVTGTTQEPIVCQPVPVWHNIQTDNMDPQLGDVIVYQCQDGLQFEDIIDEEEPDGEPDIDVTKTCKCSETDGSWEQDFVECLELVDEAAEKAYWTPVEAKNAEFIGLAAIIFLALEVAFIFIMDSPAFLKMYKSFQKKRMAKLKQRTHNRVHQSMEQPNQQANRVSIEELGDDSLV